MCGENLALVQEQRLHAADAAAEPDLRGQPRPFVAALRVPAEADEIARARAIARNHAERAGFSPARCADVALAVGEVCANVVVHAYRGGPRGTFVLQVESAPGSLTVRVTDDGCGLAPRNDSPGAGYGLPLVAAVTSALELRAPAGGGTEVRMSFSC